MQIEFLDSVDSTQAYLKNLVKNSKINELYAVVSQIQTNGIGSRNNSWKSIEGNLFLSFAISITKLPKDLKLESASIYFAFILKELLTAKNSNVWLKWPNDFYINEKKIGGMITNVVEDYLICGVGINLIDSPSSFSKLDINISTKELVYSYLGNIENNSLWKQIFSKYKIEFYRNKRYYTHINNQKVSLKSASLQSDGSLIINGERIYSLR